MEQETLFTSSKWDILKCLATGKKSPLELAKESNTSVANISQQLRLLELAGFVKSERIANRDKGLPRILYSLAENYSYLVVSTPGFVEKKFLKLKEYQKIIMRIWFIENAALQPYVERFFWGIEKYLEKISFFAIDDSDTKTVKVAVISDNAEVKKTVKDTLIDGALGQKQFLVTFIKEQDIKKHLSAYHILHDPALLGTGAKHE